ncbi:28S ribosomal protein S5, mitochondrial [Hylaeus volcanicus]|uniref:28S ribosomal protein S5, mitochondrial n=1 Tax=Hylaeus volcanicus TaxID=313075 RepID=UPI0023B8170A|nr:28S ribosomal protein S5, mitochondrial [Hylaeus volcanicus]
MAHRILRVCGLISNCAKSSIIRNNALAVGLLKPSVPLVQDARNINFFKRRPASALWKSVTSVSNAGRKRGRGRGVPRIKNLNKGQIIGVGKEALILPGLNSPLLQGNQLNNPYRVPKDPNSEEESQKPRVQLSLHKRNKVSPLDRGWSGGIIGGRKLGPPDPIDEEPFIGFQTWVLHFHQCAIMTGMFGRKKRVIVYAVTGNGKGLAGFATALRGDNKGALTLARNKAGQRLMYFERYDDHTILHDFYAEFGRTKIFAKQKPKGYGLKCHRVIAACCEAIGIKNLHAKIEGSLNIPNVIKAFFIGMLNQKSYQEMADEKKLHVVQFKKEHDYFPEVLASPETVRTSAEIANNEILDFKQYLMDGRLILNKKKPLPFFTKLPSYDIFLRKQERKRDQDKVRIRLRAEYGELCSFLTEKYPEAKIPKWERHIKKPKEEEEEAETN